MKALSKWTNVVTQNCLGYGLPVACHNSPLWSSEWTMEFMTLAICMETTCHMNANISMEPVLLTDGLIYAPWLQKWLEKGREV